MVKHLTDEEVQLYAIDKKQRTIHVSEHVNLCKECKAKVDIYLVLINGIRQQPQPAFDFDLAATVLKQLPARSPGIANDKLLTWIFIFICAGLIGTVFYFFRGFLDNMFKGIASISIYLIVISAITVIAMLFVEMYRKYKKEMNVLDLY